MKQLKFLGLLALSIISFSSCEDDEENDTKEALLVGKNWKLIAEVADPAWPYGNTTVSDFYAQNDDCYNDNLSFFEKDGTFLYDEGPTKCDESQSQVVTGTWALNFDKTVISVTAGSETESYTIEDLTKSTLKVSHKIRHSETGLLHTITETYRAQ